MAGAFRLNLDNSIVVPPRARIKGAMDDLDRPPLSAYDLEQIETEMCEQDDRYWDQLRKLQLPFESQVLMATGRIPDRPKRPLHLRAILQAYAQSLFYSQNAYVLKIECGDYRFDGNSER